MTKLYEVLIYHKQEPLVSLAICTICLLRQLGILLLLRPLIKLGFSFRHRPRSFEMNFIYKLIAFLTFVIFHFILVLTLLLHVCVFFPLPRL
jgi:hypothetical protein